MLVIVYKKQKLKMNITVSNQWNPDCINFIDKFNLSSFEFAVTADDIYR
jgi:hypothetical protein